MGVSKLKIVKDAGLERESSCLRTVPRGEEPSVLAVLVPLER